MSEEKSNADLEEKCEAITKKLKDQGINFLALDFDLTVLDVHTGGRWLGQAADLTPHIRPLFRHLIPQAIDAGIFTAIVTFSPQVHMIAAVLNEAFPGKGDQIPIRGEDGSWEYEGSGSTAGKQAHMASAVEELSAKNNTCQITRATTLLIDDDINNVSIALQEGVKSLWCNPDEPDSLTDELLRL
mmetsp:Transcript_17129/g.22623  ORF Transcript_17129/g.22623 Transcript_17129/m.22623 type:complete len:186 (+) Transcript_17129:255-812(+)|eukprot:CAMPEP_0117768544 /NCGR_PEP_ID=MMETSP0947-20121206/22448_1 /TAXON_ID=44440 /ORGANISM="Chattonella subsalsa, Strain CCMP2191" /LENGTH=185 /DNA_ID=CAMNT_0005592765 /DNA_START=187 /DNA_END=744 /DNA_ORIENTATION=-